jgi:F420-dependent oxidoreductase-like protein
MRVELMIEGQEDVSWPQWVALAQACEEHGVGTLFRSDHYLSVDGHDERGSLETWTTLAGLAAVTSRLRLGVLVTPATFRHPSVLAKAVTAVDHISGGRVELGLGVGWHEAEHAAFGFAFPPLGERLEMLEEQLAVLRGAWADGPFSFEGKHYRLGPVDVHPKPVQRPHPPLIIGGGAKPRTVRMAAQFADEYNTVFATPAECAERRAVCERGWKDAGRDPATLTFSVMVPWLSGTDSADLQRRAERLAAWKGGDSDAATLIAECAQMGVAGTLEEASERLRAYRDAGVDRIMLQHLLHDDLDAIALLARLAVDVA